MRVTLFGAQDRFRLPIFNLLPTLTAWENITLPFVARRCFPKEADRKAHLLLRRSVWNRVSIICPKNFGAKYSGFAVARALAFEPPFSWPTSPPAISIENGDAILSLLRGSTKNRAARWSGYAQSGAASYAPNYPFARRSGGERSAVMLRLLKHYLLAPCSASSPETASPFCIVLGVAVIVAIAVVNRSLTTSFSRPSIKFAGKAVLQVANEERHCRVVVSRFVTLRSSRCGAAVGRIFARCRRAGRTALRLRVDFAHGFRRSRASVCRFSFEFIGRSDFIANPTPSLSPIFLTRLNLPLGEKVVCSQSQGKRDYTVRALLKEQERQRCSAAASP